MAVTVTHVAINEAKNEKAHGYKDLLLVKLLESSVYIGKRQSTDYTSSSKINFPKVQFEITFKNDLLG